MVLLPGVCPPAVDAEGGRKGVPPEGAAPNLHDHSAVAVAISEADGAMSRGRGTETASMLGGKRVGGSVQGTASGHSVGAAGGGKRPKRLMLHESQTEYVRVATAVKGHDAGEPELFL